jgi:hypothetical protein
MTHPLYTPSTARSPKVISFEPLQRGADAAEAAIRARRRTNSSPR